jgi:hypothetical protein
VAGSLEDLPATIRNVLIERGSHHRSANVAGTTANQAWLLDFVKAVGVLEVGQVSQRLVLVGTPAVKIGFVARAFGTADAFGRILIDTDNVTLIIVVVGAKIVGVVPFARGFGM